MSHEVLRATKKGKSMSKKMTLLALAVVSAAAFAIPAAASATENHLTNVTSFSGTVNSGSLTAEGEPIITCGDATNVSHVEGTVSAGGTTGNITMDFTGCHTSVFGFTAACKTEGAPLNNTIKSSGAFHFITTEKTKSGILVTPVHTTIICAGISNTTVTGNVIGTVTSPECGKSSSTMVIDFNASGAVQEDKVSHTGVSYNLTSQTAGSPDIKQAGLSTQATVHSPTTGTMDCT
jgi:hypothetical protein